MAAGVLVPVILMCARPCIAKAHFPFFETGWFYGYSSPCCSSSASSLFPGCFSVIQKRRGKPSWRHWKNGESTDLQPQLTSEAHRPIQHLMPNSNRGNRCWPNRAALPVDQQEDNRPARHIGHRISNGPRCVKRQLHALMSQKWLDRRHG